MRLAKACASIFLPLCARAEEMRLGETMGQKVMMQQSKCSMRQQAITKGKTNSVFADKVKVDYVGFNITPWTREEELLEMKDEVDVRSWFTLQRAKIPSIAAQVKKLAEDPQGALIYIEIGYNERTPQGARENCHAEEIFRYVNQRFKEILPDMTVIKITAPKQLMREVESGVLQPSYEVDEIDAGKDIRDAYPKITHLRDSLDHETFAFIRRVLTFEYTGDCLYEPVNEYTMKRWFESLIDESAYSDEGNPAMPTPSCFR